MSWDLTLRRLDGIPLGERDPVQQVIELACPGVQFYREPSGAEKLASVPHVTFPDVVRQHMETRTAQRQGDFDGPDFSLRFYLGDEDATTINVVDIEARGKTQNAVPLLRKLTTYTGWIVVDGWGDTIAGCEPLEHEPS